MTVWCMRTWLSTEPSEYFVSSRGAAASTASEIAIPSEPVESGCSARIARPVFGLLGRARDDAPAERLDQPAAVRLLVVRGADHPDVDLEPEDPARERQRGAPLARSRLGREPRDALLLVVVGLRDGGVRLVRARRRDALVLVVDARGRLERALEPARAVERRRPPLAVDRAHLLRDRDEPVRRDLLQDDLPSGRAARGRPAPPAAPCRDAARAEEATEDRRRCCTRPPGAGLSSRTYFTWSDISRSSPWRTAWPESGAARLDGQADAQ